MIILEHQPQVHLNFYSIFIMEKVAVKSTASKDAVTIMIYDLDRAKVF